MTPRERLHRAFAGLPVDRIPYLPKIWVDLAAALVGVDLRRVIEDPELAMRVIVDAALLVGADGARQFTFPGRKALSVGDLVYEVDTDGKRIGVIDMAGGLATQLEDDSLFRIDDPACIAFYRNWKTREPAIVSLSDAKRIAVPGKQFYEQAGLGDAQRRMIGYAGNRLGLVGDLDTPTLAFYAAFRGMENALIDLFDNSSLAHAVMEKGVACSIERGKFNVDLGLRVLRLNDSMANMTLISPAQWKEFIYPHFKAVCDELHRYDPDVKIYCHICGNVLPIIEMLVDAGLDAVGPLDPLGGFSVAQARQRVGDKMVLMGGINTLSFIQASVEDIRDEACRCIEQGAVGNSRYVLGSGCVVPRAATADALRAAASATLDTVK